MSHNLHKLIAGTVKEQVHLHSGAEVILDEACGENQQLPFFCSPERNRGNQFCKVDLLVLQNKKVCVVMEIEESNIKPTQIGGKFITTALSSYYIHDTEEEPRKMAESVLFIQVVDGSKLKDRSKKLKQFENFEARIREVIPLKNSSVKDYRLFAWSEQESDKVLSDIVKVIKSVLRSGEGH